MASLLLHLQQISGYMIVLRVAQGRAWASNTLTMGAVSTNIRFNPPTTLGDSYDKDSTAAEYDQESMQT